MTFREYMATLPEAERLALETEGNRLLAEIDREEQEKVLDFQSAKEKYVPPMEM